MLSILDYDAIFFDFDGLLVNTEHLHFQAYQNMMMQNGSSFPWNFPTFASVAHKSSTGLRLLITDHAPQLVEQKGWDTLYKQKKETYQTLLEKGSLEFMPGVKELISAVQKANIPHCIVTNSTKRQVDLISKHLIALQSIPLVVTREDYQEPKPAPDGYLKAIDLLGNPRKKIGFEDSMRGIRSLQQAGIDPVLICSDDHPQMEEAKKEPFPHFSTFYTFMEKRLDTARPL